MIQNIVQIVFYSSFKSNIKSELLLLTFYLTIFSLFSKNGILKDLLEVILHTN